MSGYEMISYLDQEMPRWRILVATDEGYSEMQRLPEYPRCKACITALTGRNESEEFVDTGPYPWGPTGDPAEDKGEWELDEDTLGYWDETFEVEDSSLVWPEEGEYDTSPVLEDDDEPLGAD